MAKQQTAKPEDELTPMQFDVVARLVSSRGQRDRDTAADLGLSMETVRAHICRAMQKTGCESRVSLALWFTERYPDEASRKNAYLLACARAVATRQRTNHRTGWRSGKIK